MVQGRNWSSDKEFIEDLRTLKQEFISGDFTDDLDRKLKALRNIRLIIAPKVDVDKEKDTIEWIKRSMGSVFFTLPNGLNGVNYNNKETIDRVMNNTMSDMLLKLQKKGIYTQEIDDVKRSMSDFRQS